MIFWLLKGDKLSSIGYHNVRMLRDNEHAYVVRAGGADNRVAARPKNVASCRGDAFAAIMVDEIAFIEQNFYGAPPAVPLPLPPRRLTPPQNSSFGP